MSMTRGSTRTSRHQEPIRFNPPSPTINPSFLPPQETRGNTEADDEISERREEREQEKKSEKKEKRKKGKKEERKKKRC